MLKRNSIKPLNTQLHVFINLKTCPQPHQHFFNCVQHVNMYHVPGKSNGKEKKISSDPAYKSITCIFYIHVDQFTYLIFFHLLQSNEQIRKCKSCGVKFHITLIPPTKNNNKICKIHFRNILFISIVKIPTSSCRYLQTCIYR